MMGAENVQTCVVCKTAKPISDFTRRALAAGGKLRRKCKACVKEDRKDHNRRYVGSARGIDVNLQKRYGIRLVDYNTLYDLQGGVCAVCGRPETHSQNGHIRRLGVDHNHRTGTVRGLLCHKCNLAIGYADDNPDRLRRAAVYLEQKTLFRPQAKSRA